MASLSDKITDVRNGQRPNTARVTVARAQAGTDLVCNDLSGWPTASKVHFVVYSIDTNNDPIPGTQIDCQGIVSSNTITSVQVLDGTDNGNSIGQVVEMLPTAAWGQDLVDGLNVSHDRDGSLKDGAVDSASILGNNVVSTAKIADGAVTNAKLGSNSVGTSNITDGVVSYAKLLSTIFSGQVQSVANSGSAGGTIYYLNLGGIKLAWGSTNTFNVVSASSGVTNKTVIWPVGFFTTIQSIHCDTRTVNSDERVSVGSSSLGTDLVQLYGFVTVSGGAASLSISYLAIGT